MKKILTGLALVGLMAMPAMSVLAVSPSPTGNLPVDPNQVFVVINTIINWMFAIILIFAVIMILIAAFTFLTSAGDAEKTKKARDYILYAIVGIVVAFLAKAIVLLVANMLGQGTGGLFQ